jgi:hypothetical protein
MTQLTWDNAVLVSPELARRHGLASGAARGRCAGAALGAGLDPDPPGVVSGGVPGVRAPVLHALLAPGRRHAGVCDRQAVPVVISGGANMKAQVPALRSYLLVWGGTAVAAWREPRQCVHRHGGLECYRQPRRGGGPDAAGAVRAEPRRLSLADAAPGAVVKS